MKRLSNIILCASLIWGVSVSCIKEQQNINEDGRVGKVFTSYVDEMVDSRTSLGSDWSIFWSTKDHITVFAGDGTGTSFTDVTVDETGMVATFKGSIELADGYHAIYPKQEDAVYVSEGEKVTMTLPVVQKPVDGSFADGMNLSMARSEGDEFHFKNVGALLAVKCPSNYASSIRIVSRDPSVKMSGKATVSYNDGNPVVVASDEAVNYVQMDGIGGFGNKMLYFVVYPGNYSKGFDIVVLNTNQTHSSIVSTTTGLDLKRNANVLLYADAFAGWNAPTAAYGLSAEAANDGMMFTWSCKADPSLLSGYDVYVRPAGSVGDGEFKGTTTTKYLLVGGLQVGSTYDFGVQAVGTSGKNSAVVWLEDVVYEESAGDDKAPQVTDVKTSYAYIAVSYKIKQLNGSNPEHGVCFSASGAPSVADIKVPGPTISANKEILQVVPNAWLEDGKEYQMCVFVKDGSEYRYSEPQTVKLDAQPDVPQLTWEKQTYVEAAGVEIYKTTSQLNGRNFNAWYAVADPAVVEFKVLNTPTGKANLKTVAHQAENADGDCLVLINGGVFGNYHIGVIHVDGQPQEWVDFVYDKYWNPNGDGTSWNITRPIIGVDEQGKAQAYWTASPSYGTYYYYNRPLPTVPGEAKYATASSSFPVQSIGWKAYNALSTGPMVLYDSKCCVDHVKAASGAYMTNYECWALDIYEGRPDRTAVGVTSDGKIVLFICDGRIDASQGATHEEVAMIMKSIGCVHAMNLDGGGSTGMWVKGAGMINCMDGSSWRAVKSTLGFFKK